MMFHRCYAHYGFDLFIFLVFSSQSHIIHVMRTVLDVPRTEYSRDVAEFVTGSASSDNLKSYQSGIIFIMSLVALMWFIWTLILLYFKCNSKHVGCAAGNAFAPRRLLSVRSSSDDEADSIKSFSESLEQKKLAEYVEEQADGKSSKESMKEGYGSSKYLQEQREVVPSRKGNHDDDNFTIIKTTHRSPRATRTRLCFLIFSLVTLGCVPCVIIFTFKPLLAARDDSISYIADSRDIIEKVKVIIDDILKTSSSATGILYKMPMDISTICPNITMEELEDELTVNLQSMVDVVATNYVGISAEVSGNISDIREALLYFADYVEAAESIFEGAAPFFWVVPTILFSLSAITVAAISGVFSAWKMQSSRGIQRYLTYIILPALILLSMACWAVAAMSAAASAVGIDACLSGSSTGSPSDTLLEVLQAENISELSPIYGYLSDYVTTCGENDPALVINALKQDIENVTDELWAAVGKVDVVGQLNIDSYCKGGNQLDAFIEGSRELALLLSTSLSSISRVTAYLECEKIHDLYASAVNGSLCSDAVDAAAWSLLFFFILGVSSMIMVTLRASWKQRVEDEKIYDESEVAENMFVDEHEEYLAYISKYKQEWEVRTLNIFMSLSFSLSQKVHIYFPF